MKQSLRYGLVAIMSVCVIALAGCNSQDLKLDLGKQTTAQTSTSQDKKAMDKMTKNRGLCTAPRWERCYATTDYDR